MAVVTPQTRLIETLKMDTLKSGADFTKKGVRLGSPISGKNVGDVFPITLTGSIEIREYNNIKGAHYLTKEGYSIKVNSSYNPEIHKEGAVLSAICKEFEREDGSKVKFTAFAD